MERIPYFDSHCDTVSYCYFRDLPMVNNGCHVAFDQTAPFSRYTQMFAYYVDTAKFEHDTYFDKAAQMHDFFLNQIAQHPDLVTHCKGKKDIAAAHARGTMAAMSSIEDGDTLNCDPEKLELAAEWGIQAIALTWNYRNRISGTCADCPDQGLTDQGREFVREAQRLDILCDVSHLSPKGFWDLYEMAEKPIVASHSNAASIQPHQRNLTDDQFRAIAASGGVAGLNLYTEFLGEPRDISVLIRHLEHFLDLGGEDHIGIGGDLDGCSEVCLGIGRLTGIPNFWTALKERGYSDALLEKLFYNNWLRVIRD